jgi:hypothetical protein
VIVAGVPNSVDPWINAFLLLAIAVFTADILLSATCRARPNWTLLLLDALATASIVVDLSWVAEAGDLDAPHGQKTSDAAVYAAKAGGVARLARLLRLLRATTLLANVARQALRRRKAADLARQRTAGARASVATAGGGAAAAPTLAPSNIGGKLTDAMAVQAALVVVLTVIATALVSTWGAAGAASPFDGCATTLAAQAGAPRALLEPQVTAMAAWVDGDTSCRLLTLRVGTEAWAWPENAWPPRRADVALFVADSAAGAAAEALGAELPAAAVLEVDVSALNRQDAVIDIVLTLLVLLILACYVAAAHATVYRALVRPLERIFQTIAVGAAQVVAALGPDDGASDPLGSGGGREGGGSGGSGGSGSEEDGDLATIEAAVQKMSRLVAHFTSAGGQGGALAAGLAEGADAATRQWLAAMAGGGAGAAPEAAAPAAAEAPATAAAKPSGASSSPASGRDKRGSGGSAGLGGGGLLGGGLLGGVVRRARAVRDSVVSFPHGASAAVTAAAAAFAPPPDGASDGRASGASLSSSVPGGAASRAATGSFGGGGALARLPALAALAGFGAGLTEAQRDALLAVDVAALHSLRFDVAALPCEALAPHVVAMFLELGVARFGAPVTGAAGSAADGAGPAAAPLAAAAPAAPAPEGGLVDAATLWRFVDALGAFYRDNPYHCLAHAVDVTHAAFVLAARIAAPARLTRVELFALMVAALAHDMEHPGFSNAFLVARRDPLAVTYNDAAVLENRHVACLYGLVAAAPEADVFAGLDEATWREVRRLVINCVLHTDMAQHFPMVSKLEVFLELRAPDVAASHAAQRAALRAAARGASAGACAGGACGGAALAYAAAAAPLPCVFATGEERALMLAALLHAADISNPARPPEVAARWADRVLAEFFAQGDAERAAGAPISPLCDRATTSRPGSQVNFIEFVVAPLFAALARVFPDAGELLENAAASRAFWHAAQLKEVAGSAGLASGASALEEAAKAEAKLAAFREKYADALAAAARRRREVRRGIAGAGAAPGALGFHASVCGSPAAPGPRSAGSSGASLGAAAGGSPLAPLAALAARGAQSVLRPSFYQSAATAPALPPPPAGGDLV